MKNLVSVTFQMVISVISFNPGLTRENKMEVISHHFLLPRLYKPVFTPQSVLNEWLVFALGQCVIDCRGSSFCFMSNAFDGIMESIDPDDVDIINEIIEELQEQHEILFSDPVFQSICFSDLEFYKFSYEMYSTSGRILFHVDEE